MAAGEAGRLGVVGTLKMVVRNEGLLALWKGSPDHFLRHRPMPDPAPPEKSSSELVIVKEPSQ